MTTETKPRTYKAGDVVNLGTEEAPRYGLVVGTEKVKHRHTNSNGEHTDTVEREHPLVVDLPTARRHEAEIAAA
jgi:hypothetical protein